ncbi:hypothetical protein H9635_03935 [Solibacillus sp. A46]|uniref:Lipoprotein n=1 Tax=Solibacillus faecavium TaxID=2762221 RepID=A0ABR8XVB1_9BACL|nr:hypothetical protein [Solibacillus faecavium]MBD8035879.1 hypothetical protein [Solibacillus faecavium]
MKKYGLSLGVMFVVGFTVFLFYFKQPTSIMESLPAVIVGEEFENAALFERETINLNQEQKKQLLELLDEENYRKKLIPNLPNTKKEIVFDLYLTGADRSFFLYIDSIKEVILIENNGRLEPFTIIDARDLLAFVESLK